MRVEINRSTVEIIYGNVDKEGQIFYEVGLPDGSIIPYEQYISNPPPNHPDPITTETPSAADPPPRLGSSMAVLYYAAAIAVILVIVLHAL